MSEKNYMDKLIRKALLKLLQQGRQIELNLVYNNSWGFIANEQGKGVSGWKIVKRNLVKYQELGDSC